MDHREKIKWWCWGSEAREGSADGKWKEGGRRRLEWGEERNCKEGGNS